MVKRYKHKSVYKRKGKSVKGHKQRYNFCNHPQWGTVSQEKARQQLFEGTKLKGATSKEETKERYTPKGQKVIDRYFEEKW